MAESRTSLSNWQEWSSARYFLLIILCHFLRYLSRYLSRDNDTRIIHQVTVDCVSVRWKKDALCNQDCAIGKKNSEDIYSGNIKQHRTFFFFSKVNNYEIYSNLLVGFFAVSWIYNKSNIVTRMQIEDKSCHDNT